MSSGFHWDCWSRAGFCAAVCNRAPTVCLVCQLSSLLTINTSISGQRARVWEHALSTAVIVHHTQVGTPHFRRLLSVFNISLGIYVPRASFVLWNMLHLMEVCHSDPVLLICSQLFKDDYYITWLAAFRRRLCSQLTIWMFRLVCRHLGRSWRHTD